MDINTSDRNEQRKFGFVMAVAIAVVGGIRWWLTASMPVWFFYIAAAFLVLGVVAPAALRPIFVVWMKLAEVLNVVMTTLLLTLAFFLIIVPTRIILAVVGHDPLKRNFDADAETYWEDADEQPEDMEAYYNRF